MSHRFNVPGKATLIQIQDDLINSYGGVAGIRDEGALEAAIERPQKISLYEGDISIFRVAASLSFGLCKIFHPFTDGNKRIALDALFVTLHLNGYFLDSSEQEVTDTILAIASGAMDEEEFTRWTEEKSYEL